MKNDLLTVAEFAKRVGKSKQSVYSRLDKGLKQFVQEVDGQKMLSAEALSVYQSINVEQGFKQDSINVDQPPKEEKTALDLLSKTIETLQKQLEEKDRQIERLTAALQTEQQHATQAQVLHAATISNAVESPTEPHSTTQEKEPARSWFSRLFGKS